VVGIGNENFAFLSVYAGTSFLFVYLKKITEVSRLRIVFGETYIPVGENYKDQFTEYINSRMMK